MVSMQQQIVLIEENILESNANKMNELEKKVDEITSIVASLSEYETIRTQEQSEQIQQLQGRMDEIYNIQEVEAKKIQYGFRTVNNYSKEIKENNKIMGNTLSQHSEIVHTFQKEQKKSSKNIEELLRLLLVHSLIDDAEAAMEIYREETVQ